MQTSGHFRKISFIGAGNMPRSIISGMIKSGYAASHIMASNPSSGKLNALKNDFDILTNQSNEDVCRWADVIVLSVKPQVMAQVCKELVSNVTLRGKLVISIAAGITVARLSELLNGYDNIVRTMPNTPSSLGLGMTGLYANEQVSKDDVSYADFVMQHVGKTLVVENEAQIDVVIAAAGSSPAYLFLFAQAMQDEAMNMGLTKDDARLLVQQALLGSATMICEHPELEISELRAQVTSKGGTTAEAIATFQALNLQDIVAKAMQSAVKKAQNMSTQL